MDLVSHGLARVLRLLEGLGLGDHLVAVLTELDKTLTSHLRIVAGWPVAAVGVVAGVGVDLTDVRPEVGTRLVVPLPRSLTLRVHLDTVLSGPHPVGLVAVPVGEREISLIRPAEGLAVERKVRIEADPEGPT